MRPEEGGAYRSNTPAICLSDLHVARRGLFGWGGEWRGSLCVVGDKGHVGKCNSSPDQRSAVKINCMYFSPHKISLIYCLFLLLVCVKYVQ